MTVTVQKTAQKRNVLSHALMFIAGFTLIFVLLGATTGILLGTFLQDDLVNILVAVGGVMLLVLGFHMSGILKLLIVRLDDTSSIRKSLTTVDRKMDELILPERRKQSGYDQSPGFVRSGVVGMTFAAGWTPCIGPLLGAILSLSLNASSSASPIGTVLTSATLLFAYSMGLAIPFFIAALLLNKATGLLRRLNKHLYIIERVSAIFLIALGVLLLFGSISELNQFFSASQPEWIYNFEASLTSYGISVPIAFLAGLLSFLSPCVLPLIPVYIGYLTGVAVSDSSHETSTVTTTS